MSEGVRPHGLRHICMGLGQHFTRAHVTFETFNDKDAADICLFGNSLFFSCFFVNTMKTIGKSNLLILENIIFTFEYVSINDVLN